MGIQSLQFYCQFLDVRLAAGVGHITEVRSSTQTRLHAPVRVQLRPLQRADHFRTLSRGTQEARVAGPGTRLIRSIDEVIIKKIVLYGKCTYLFDKIVILVEQQKQTDPKSGDKTIIGMAVI